MLIVCGWVYRSSRLLVEKQVNASASKTISRMLVPTSALLIPFARRLFGLVTLMGFSEAIGRVVLPARSRKHLRGKRRA
jgi:hypothetical protein